jgi:hypothetical protein
MAVIATTMLPWLFYVASVAGFGHVGELALRDADLVCVLSGMRLATRCAD